VNNERTSIIRTLCKGCVFKEEKDGVQTGCKLGRIATFLSRGVEVLYEDNAYIIKKLCNACRDQEWGKDKDNFFDSLRSEIEPTIDYIVHDDESEPNLDQIRKTLDSIILQDIKPNLIIVSVRKSAGEIYNQLTELGYKVKVTLSLLADFRDKMIDGCFKQCEGQFYTVVDAGQEIDQTFSYIINHLLNERLENFVLLEDGTPELPTVIFSKIHPMLGGNRGSLLTEKINALAKDQDSDMVRKWSDVLKT
jgi:hypothetical protein